MDPALYGRENLGQVVTFDRLFWGWGLVAIASALVSGYHGYKSHGNDAGAAIGWGLLGFFFPVIVPVYALASGYAEPA